MQFLSPRLGYYIIAVGVTIQFLGFAGDAWMQGQNPDQARDSLLALSNPASVLLVLGLAITVLGTVVGMLSLLSPDSVAALRPFAHALPLIVVGFVSVGSMVFAYQVSGSPTPAEPKNVSAAPVDDIVKDLNDPTNCPEGTAWHEEMGHCMIPTTPGADDSGDVVCPAGYFWHQAMGHCMERALAPDDGAAAGCPDGYFWHDAMGHCMAQALAPPDTSGCPDGYFWHDAMGHCMALDSTSVEGSEGSCPAGYFWHSQMGHCMAVEAPRGGAEPVACPPGYAWHEEMGHCMVYGPTPTGEPTCPPGYFWHQQMGHCMAIATPGPTPTGVPECPPGQAWHPEMNHCMPYTPTPTPTTPSCPPGRVWDPVQGRCVPPSQLPTPLPTTMECPPGYLWHPDMGHCMPIELFTPTPTATPAP